MSDVEPGEYVLSIDCIGTVEGERIAVAELPDVPFTVIDPEASPAVPADAADGTPPAGMPVDAPREQAAPTPSVPASAVHTAPEFTG